MTRFTAATAVLLFLSQAALAAPTSTKEPSDKSAPDHVRCVKVNLTGSLIGHGRECHTNAEWQARSAASNREVRANMQNSGSGAYNPPN